MSYNRAILIGRVGRDPETRRSNSGDAIVNFSLATSESWKDKSTGERKERATWHNVVCFNENIGRIAEQYVKKGSQIMVEGKIAHREYTDRDGNKRTATEIVIDRFDGSLKLLGSRDGGGRSDDDQGSRSRDTRPATSSGSGKMGDYIDDDIPF